MKRFLLSTIVLMAAILILAAVILFVPPAFRLGLKTANRFLPVTLEIAEYHHAPGRLNIAGVGVATPRGTFFEMAGLRIEYRPLALVTGRFDVSTLELENPRVTIQRLEDGQLNLPGADREQEKAEEEDTEAWISLLRPLRIKVVRIVEGSVRFEDREKGLSLAWEAVDVEGAFSGHPLVGALTLSKGLLKASGGTCPPLEIHTKGHASLDESLLQLDRFQMKTQESSVSLRGRYVVGDENLALNAKVEDLPLSHILTCFGISGVPVEELSGTFEAKTTDRKEWLLRADLRGKAYGHEAESRLAGTLLEQRIRVESLELSIPEAALTGQASWEFETGALDGNLVLASSALQDAFRPYGIQGLRVQGLHLDGALRGTLRDPEVRLQLQIDEIYYRRPLVTGFTAEGGMGTDRGIHLTGNAKRIDFLGEAGRAGRISANVHQGIATCEIRAEPSLTVEGRLNLEDRDAEVAVSARQLSLSFLLEDAIASDATLSLTGEGSFRGILDEKETWKGDAQIAMLRFSMPSLLVQTARPAKVRVGQGQLRGEAALEANGSRLAVNGSYRLEGDRNLSLDVTGTLSLEDFYRPARHFLPVLEGWQGDLRIQGTVMGPVKTARLRAVAELSEGSIRLLLPKGDGQESFAEMEEDKQEEVAEEPPTEGILAERVQAKLALDGPLTTPPGTLNIRIREGSLFGEPLDEVQLKADSRDGRTWNQLLEIRRGTDMLSVDGQWEVPTGKISGSIGTSELNLATLVKTEGWPLEGRSELHGTIEGTVESPHLGLRVTAKSLAIQDTTVGDLDADVVYEGDRVSIRCRTDSGPFEISLNLDEKREFSFQGSLQDLPLGPILERANLRGWTGGTSLSGRLKGPLTDVERWQGEISLEKLNLQAGGIPVRLDKPVVLRFEHRSLTVPDTSLYFEGSPLHLKGTLGRENRLTLQGAVPLCPFASLIPWVRFDTARAEADLVIGGSLSSPLVDGTLHLEAGQVKFEGLTYPIDSVKADIKADSNRFTVVSLTAHAADGEIRGSGTVAVAPLSFENVKLVLDSVPVRLADSFGARLRGELRLQGTRTRSLLHGRLRIIEARYEEDFDIAGMVLRPSRPSRKRVKAADPLLRNMRMDLNIQSGPDLIVRNNIARVVLSTDMDIQGTMANPVPLGIVKVEEGRVYFSKKKFDITQGTLSFIDPQGGPPKLQLESMVEVQGEDRQYTIYLTFTGTLDRIQLELRSVPDLEREDIIFMLVTGKTRDEFYASSTESDDTEETAQRLALSGIGFLFGSDVRELTGLDTFEMERTEGEEFGVRTTVGKRFNERVEVRGVFALGSGQQVSEAQIGYLLTDILYVVGTQRTDGSFGLDFRVRITSR
jgi:hypothetical protein